MTRKTDLKSKVQFFLNHLRTAVLDDKKRETIFYELTSGVLGLVAAFMTVVNLCTGEYALMCVTGVFALLCVINCFLYLRSGVTKTLAIWLFLTEIIGLFVYFLITGRPQGFSIIWTALLPSCGLLVFGRKRGSIMGILFLAILIFFFWTPVGKSMLLFEYNPTFELRFPFLYFAFFVIGFVISLILLALQNALYTASTHDALTGALNRVGFDENVRAVFDAQPIDAPIAFLIVDIDKFKNINDLHGHLSGDVVLKRMAELFTEISGQPVCRWGGEEFVLILPDGTKAGEVAERMCKEARKIEYMDEEGNPFFVTVSVGAFVKHYENGDTSSHLCREADACLYRAKSEGRDTFVVNDRTVSLI